MARSLGAVEIAIFAGVDDLTALRPAAVNALIQASGSEEKLEVMALVAGRGCLLVCDEMDALINSGESLGAVHDASIYARCANSFPIAPPSCVESDLTYLAGVANDTIKYLTGTGLLDDFANLLAELLDVAAFKTEPDDLILHRCLHAWYAFAETYLRTQLATLNPAEYIDGRGAAGYEKGDCNQAVLDTARGPILGHHHYLSPLVATCAATDIPLHAVFVSYADAVITYMPDWESLPREHGMVSAITSALGTPVERARRDPAHTDDPAWIGLRRNTLGTKSVRWFSRMGHAIGVDDNASLLHTGILCNLAEPVRKVAMVCLGYGQFGLWPVPRMLSLADYGRYGCAALGEMLRGWASDHDAEAAIGEHSPLNWLCVECARLASRDCMMRYNALGYRDEWEMRIAWAPQTFNFIGGRHQGLRRRVDNLRARAASVDGALVRRVPPSCVPISSGDQIDTIVTKLLALAGLGPEPGLVERLELDTWKVQLRMCSECDFAGSRDQMFMLAVGCARLGTLLPKHHMETLIPLIEKYAYRLFPALQVRLLTQCGCTPFWVADILSSGYEDAGMSCGLGSCLATRDPMPPTATWDHPAEDEKFGGVTLRKQLLDQAITEARQYALATGQIEWFSLVIQPIGDL